MHPHDGMLLATFGLAAARRADALRRAIFESGIVIVCNGLEIFTFTFFTS